MKLQIEGQKLRVRIDEDELARLLAGEVVETGTQFADAFAIRFEVRAIQGAASFSGQADTWLISLPMAAVREHAQRLPTREGLRYSLARKDSAESLDMLFDVDVRDSVIRRRSS
jgi:hypothetical protein